MFARRLKIGLAVAALLANPLAAFAAETDQLSQDIAQVEKLIKDKAGDAPRLKEWLGHARDYKSGERNDPPGPAPR